MEQALEAKLLEKQTDALKRALLNLSSASNTNSNGDLVWGASKHEVEGAVDAINEAVDSVLATINPAAFKYYNAKGNNMDTVDKLHDFLTDLFQSPMDYASDGYYDFFFTPNNDGLHLKEEFNNGETIDVQIKKHLCIKIDDDSGLISYYTNLVRADKEHSYITDCHLANDVLAHYGLLSPEDVILEKLEELGITFDLLGINPNGFGELYSTTTLFSYALQNVLSEQ